MIVLSGKEQLMIKLINIRLIIVILTLSSLICSHPLYADDVTDSINEALDAYNEGEYSDAVDSLNYASQLIQQKKSENLTMFLPEPLEDWTSKKPKSSAAGSSMFGGGITATRQYKKGENNITIEIVADSPLLQSVMMMFSNPMYATSDGGKLEKIKRQKAIVKFDPDASRGDIKIVIANRFLVTVTGNRTTLEDLKAYAKAIDYKKMSAMQ
jgi:hypothetical protein